MYTKLRNKVPCDCKTCNGKYVEYRTRKSHIELERNLASCVSGFLPGNSDNSSAHVLKVCHSPIAEGSSRSKKRLNQKDLQGQKKRLNKKSQLHLTVIMNQILMFLFLQKGED